MRELILRDNVVRKSSASARLWAWKRLKLRYALDPDIAEHRAFVSGMSATADPQERGLLAFLMLARTDRLFRETTLECVSPNLLKHEVVIEAESIEVTMRRLAEASGLKWSVNALDSAHRHFLTALKDFGLLRGSRPKRTVRPRPGPQTTLFAARLSRLEGLTDLQLLDARWFRLLGLTSSQVINLLQTAARSGELSFRMQADVVELSLPPLEAA